MNKTAMASEVCSAVVRDRHKSVLIGMMFRWHEMCCEKETQGDVTDNVIKGKT